VSALLWVDNNTFFAIYSRPRDAEEPSHTPFILERNSKGEVSYLQLEQVSDFTSSDSDVNSHFYLQLVRKLGSDIPFLITIANANATALNLVGKETDGKWSTWLIENGGIPKLPTSSSFDDTFPIGLDVDYSSLESFTADESSETVPPMPILFFLTNEGKLCAYHYYSSKMVENGEKFDNMVSTIDIKLIPEADMTKTTAKKEALPDKETKALNKDVKKPNPEPVNARVSKVPVIKTGAKFDENNKSNVSTSPTSSTPSGIPRLKHASIGWGSLSNASNTSVPAKSNVAHLDDVNTSATKKPDTSLTDKTKPTLKQAFGQSANVNLSSKNPFGSTSFVPKPKSEQAEAEQAPKPSSSSNTEHSDSHSSAGSDDFVKISTDFSNNETQDTNEAKYTTNPVSYPDRNTDQNDSQDVNQTQPAPNQQKNKKEMTSQEQQDGEKRESQKEPEIATSAEQNVDKSLPAEPEQITDEDTTVISPENDSKKQELEQKEKSTKEPSTKPEQSNKEEQADVSGQGDEEKSPALDESKTDQEKEVLTPKDKDVNKVAETVAKDSEVKKQDPVPIEEQVKEKEPVLKDDKQEETETPVNQDSALETAVQVEKEVDVENKKEAPIESKEAPTESKEASVQDPKSEESSIQQVPEESEEIDKPKDEAGSPEDSDQEEFEKIEKPETPELVEEDNSQVAKVASNSEEKNPEPVSNLDKQNDAPSDTTSTPDQEVKTTPKEIDVQLGESGINETEKKEAEVIVTEPSNGRTTLTNDSATSEVPVNNQKPDETKNENTFDEMTDERISHTIDDETTSTADELSTDDEGTEELEELSTSDEGTEELEEYMEEEFEAEPPKPKTEIFFETYQKKHLQPTQNFQNTGTHVS
jgi:hypothetical protein